MKAKKFLTGMSAVTLAAIMMTAVSASAAAEDEPKVDETASSTDVVVSSEGDVETSEAEKEETDEIEVSEADVVTSEADIPDVDSSAAEEAEPEKESFISVTEGDELIPGETDEKGSSVVIVPSDKVADLPEGEKVGVTVDFETIESYYDPDATGTVEGALKKANIAFVIDTTGSMGGYIKNVKENLSDFVKGLKDKGVEPTMSIIEYRDITADGKDSTIFHTFGDSRWTTDIDAVIAEFDKLTVDGGGDGPETTLDAFDKLFEEDPTWYKMDGSSFVFVLTDATTKEGEDASASGRTLAEWGDIMAKEGIQVSVVASSYLEDDYEDLYGKTGGNFFKISGDNYSDLMLEYATSISSHIDHTVPYTDRSITLAGLKKYAVSETGAGTVTFILTPDEAKTLLGADATDELLSKFTFKLHGVDVVKVTITTDTEDLTETEGVTDVPSDAPASSAKNPDSNPETGSSAKSIAAVLALAGAVLATRKVKKD